MYGASDVKRKVLVRTDVIFPSTSQAATQRRVSERSDVREFFGPFVATYPHIHFLLYHHTEFAHTSKNPSHGTRHRLTAGEPH